MNVCARLLLLHVCQQRFKKLMLHSKLAEGEGLSNEQLFGYQHARVTGYSFRDLCAAMTKGGKSNLSA